MLFNEYGDLLTLNDICSILGVKAATAGRLCRERKIQAFKVGREWRITRLALEAYVIAESNYSPCR
ncbi:helix-turn-helix domain-containing protein [Lacrimispora sp.]|uniref:helix-turn-helix domain-containing protein n=1 Tax=Lacrimispora sp. TaxID=2719234 RepID=UPI0029E47349|nr:Helix-turn-helix domain [Lacrimispora sp.]